MAKTQARRTVAGKKTVKVAGRPTAGKAAAKAQKVVRPKKAAKASRVAKPSKVTKPGKAVRAVKGRGFRHVHPTRKLELPKGAGSGDLQKMAREIDKRVQGYEREMDKARKAIAKLSQAVQKSTQVTAGKAEKGPRRFRAAVVKMRDLQRAMTDNSTQMRLVAARRQELLWLKALLTGEAPRVTTPAAPSVSVPTPVPTVTSAVAPIQTPGAPAGESPD